MTLSMRSLNLILLSCALTASSGCNTVPQWHMQQAWAPLIFADEVDDSNERDPVAPSQPSAHARRKASTKLRHKDCGDNLPKGWAKGPTAQSERLISCSN